MNTTTPYEKLMAAKLDEVPVPDMADSIWSSIEMQLDAVADTPDNTPDNKAPGKKTIKFNGKGWYGIAGVTAVAVSLWWYASNKDHTEKIMPVKTVPVIQAPAPVSDSNASVVPLEKQPLAPLNTKKDTVLLMEKTSAAPEIDSMAREFLPPVKPDSPLLKYQRIFIPLRDSVSTPAPKKPRGVKGITEDDYRISATDDSTGKKE